MLITPVADALTAHGLAAPTLNVLTPDVNNYSVLLLQPHGQIEASAAGVRNRDRALAEDQFGQFLRRAHELQVDLSITPEYSMPWDVLIGAIKAGTAPATGKIWALGCESIQYTRLKEIKQDLAERAIVVFEDLGDEPARFTDPLAYVFATERTDGTGARMVVLVQFKTHPMGDDDHFEINGLQRGNCVYRFGPPAQGIGLISLICSDVFGFLDQHAEAVYDRGLTIHIQLNPKPRHEQYRLYRDRLLRFQGDATELICLNWARNVCEWSSGHEKRWSNIAASAWYLKSDRFDDRDAPLCANHLKGFYYTWFRQHRAHAMFFNYDPAMFLLQASKVAHLGVAAAVSRRRGPQVASTFTWNSEDRKWIAQSEARDGFDEVLAESGSAGDELRRICGASPLAVERVVALCAGHITAGESWHDVRSLDSCMIDATEIIRRITFCQDTSEEATAFRIERLRRCGHLFEILKDSNNLPPSLADLKGGFQFDWFAESPHQNVTSAGGSRATAIYMGEGSNSSQVDKVSRVAAEHLHRASGNAGESLRAKQRLAVWFRKDNAITLNDPHRYAKIDQTGEISEFDIGRES
jgi:hypothetical protein